MTDEDWGAGFAKSLMVFLNGAAIAGRGPRGERIEDDSFLLLFNAHHEAVVFTLGLVGGKPRWYTCIDTSRPAPRRRKSLAGGDRITVAARSLLVLSDSERC